MRKVSLYSYVTNEGERIPYRFAAGDEKDDRVEHGIFLTDVEFEALKSSLVSSSELRRETIEQAERRAFQAAMTIDFTDPFGDRPTAEDWESAYEAWREGVYMGVL